MYVRYARKQGEFNDGDTVKARLRSLSEHRSHALEPRAVNNYNDVYVYYHYTCIHLLHIV